MKERPCANCEDEPQRWDVWGNFCSKGCRDEFEGAGDYAEEREQS